MDKVASADILREASKTLRSLAVENADLREKVAGVQQELDSLRRASRVVDLMEARAGGGSVVPHLEKAAALISSGRRLDVIEEATKLATNPEALRLTKLASSGNDDDDSDYSGSISESERAVDYFLATGDLLD